MELLLLPSRVPAAAAASWVPRASSLRRAGVTARPAAASSSNVEVIDATASSSAPGAAVDRHGRRGGGGLGLDLPEELRRGMVWRMLAAPAAAVAGDAAFMRLLDAAAPGDVPDWAAVAGSAVLFAAGLLGVHYGFLSSRWDAAETGSVVGWDLAVRHWNALSMAKEYSSVAEEEDEDEDEDEEEEDEDEEEEDYDEEGDEDDED